MFGDLEACMVPDSPADISCPSQHVESVGVALLRQCPCSELVERPGLHERVVGGSCSLPGGLEHLTPDTPVARLRYGGIRRTSECHRRVVVMNRCGRPDTRNDRRPCAGDQAGIDFGIAPGREAFCSRGAIDWKIEEGR